jgi:hypothetical protein
MGGSVLDSFDPGQRPVAGSSEHGKELSDTIKDKEFD